MLKIKGKPIQTLEDFCGMCSEAKNVCENFLFGRVLRFMDFCEISILDENKGAAFADLGSIVDLNKI